MFHFNKAHLTDPNIPMWVIKAKGETFYVKHVDVDCPFSTKETPDNPSTKGSLKFKDCCVEIDADLNAKITSMIKCEDWKEEQAKLDLCAV